MLPSEQGRGNIQVVAPTVLSLTFDSPRSTSPHTPDLT